MEPNKDENNTSERKRKADPKSYQRNIIKKSRVRGEPYKNNKGDDVPSKILGPPCRGSTKIEVCLKAFSSIYSVTLRRLRMLKHLAVLRKSPKDLRGQSTSGNKLGEDIQLAVRHHIESFPVKLSHYANRDIKYLHSELNLKIMYDLFKQKYPTLKVSYSYYTRYFRENFSLRFGRPQVDFCATCETLNNKIKNQHLNEVAKRTAEAELMVHKRRTKTFCTKLKSESELVPGDADNILALSFDYMQNIQLPKTPVGDVFYYQQLTVSVFCIHDIKENTAKMYIYHEGQAKKLLMRFALLDYMKDTPENINEVRL
nr:unnamed protein product [Callosobruchus chinensis]